MLMENEKIALLQRKKKEQSKIAMLTAYDFNSALKCDISGVDVILVGDSLGRMVQGNEDALNVTITEMMYHTRIVAKGVRMALLVADMPYQTYETPEDAVKNAKLLVEQGGCDAVMLQGRSVAPSVKAIVEAGIPVFGCVGMDPSLIADLGPYSSRSENPKEEYAVVLKAALELERAGCSAIVLRTIPASLGRHITQLLKIPVIGIGAGKNVDGQLLLFHDMMGITDDFRAKHVRRYAHLSQVMLQGVRSYISDVERGNYPSEDHEY
jgi:3-methyl-2-oxobutanoate hydroxymethyltransferase